MKLVPLLLLTSSLLSTPYYGGTLLSSIPENIPPGTWYFAPYLFITHQYSSPNHNYIQMQWEIETGITPWLDIALYPNFYYTSNSLLIGDTQLALGFQILNEQDNIPALRFILQESFPSGKYDRLTHLSQATGTGTYQTWFTTVLYKTLTPYTVNLTLSYVLSSHATPHGLNVYNPGDQFIGNLGFEYSLTQTTILGLDLHYQYQDPSSNQYSLAPCIEYNPSPNLSFEAGPWFTIAGHNAPTFTSAVLTMYWQF